MSDYPTDISGERLNRLSTAVADLMDASNRQGRDILRAITAMSERFDRIDDRLGSVERAVRELAADQLLLANRVTARQSGRRRLQPCIASQHQAR